MAAQLSTIGALIATEISGQYRFRDYNQYTKITDTKIVILPSNYEPARGRSRCSTNRLTYEIKVMSKQTQFQSHVQSAELTIDTLNSMNISGYKVLEIQTVSFIDWQTVQNNKLVTTTILITLEK